MSESDIQYLTEALTVDLAEMLSKDFNMNILESLDTLYNSEILLPACITKVLYMYTPTSNKK